MRTPVPQWQDFAADPSKAAGIPFNADQALVGVISNALKGMVYSFAEERIEWSWLEMVAQLTNESMKKVVEGEDGRSRGLVGWAFAIRENGYDHKRHVAAVAACRDQKTPQLPPWDFVLFRDDGSGLRLHPEWSKTAVAAYHVDCHEEPVMPPMKGCGESWGSGTYRYYKKLGVINNLKFDARKGAKLGSEPKTSPTESVTPLPFRPCSSHPPLHAPDPPPATPAVAAHRDFIPHPPAAPPPSTACPGPHAAGVDIGPPPRTPPPARPCPVLQIGEVRRPPPSEARPQSRLRSRPSKPRGRSRGRA